MVSPIVTINAWYKTATKRSHVVLYDDHGTFELSIFNKMAWGLLEKQKPHKMLAWKHVPLFIKLVDLNDREQCRNGRVWGCQATCSTTYWCDIEIIISYCVKLITLAACLCVQHVFSGRECVWVRRKLEQHLYSLVLIVNSPHLFSV